MGEYNAYVGLDFHKDRLRQRPVYRRFGRLFIKSGGEWISSLALESALMAHPKVAEAAVFAVPDERWSERPMGVVVLAKDAGPVSPEELRAHLEPQFAKFWLPDKFVFVDEISKTSVGKFDKKVLRKRYAEGELG
jgi:fatty-acyl-CoA synthase